MTITDPARVLKWTGFKGTTEDEVFTDAWNAAEDYVSDRCTWPTVDDEGNELDPPATLVEAVNLLTGRYLARRNSPDGMVGLGELGAAQVPVSDRDVNRMLAPWRTQVIG